MSETNGQRLPQGWAESALGAVLTFHYGKGLPENRRQVGRVPVYGSNGRVGCHDQALVEGPVIVIGRKGTVGAIHFEAGPCWPIDTTYFIDDFTGLHPRFVSYQLRHLRLGQFDKSTAIPGIGRDDVYSRGFIICPLPEQERIADTLDEIFSDLDAGVAALERVRDKLKLYRASVLNAAVEGALTTEWRAQHPHTEPATELLNRILAGRQRLWEQDHLAKFKAKGRQPPKHWKTKCKEPAAPDTTTLPPLPAGWCWAAVEQVGEVRLGRQRAPQHHRGDHMRPYLRVANVYEDRLDLRDVKRMNFTPDEFATYALRYGDILLNEGQSPELVGRPALYRDEIPGCCYQKTLLRFRAYRGLLPAYALSAFRACLHSGRFRKSANITTSIAHLAAERFVSIEFPLPPVAEQEAIGEAVEDHLSIIDHLEADLNAKLKNAQGLRQAILRHAFTGQLVPQDPNDEPASELLKRIAAEREERGAPISRRRRAAS